MSECSRNTARVEAVDGGCADAAAAPNPSNDDLFTLAVVARIFKIAPLVLRRYELAGLVRRRRVGNVRAFDWNDFERIARMVKARAAGLRIGDVKAIIRAMDESAPRRVTEAGRRGCVDLIHALEERQHATGKVLAKLYHIDRELGEQLGALV